LIVHAYDSVCAAWHDDDASTSSPTVSPAKNCPGEYANPSAPSAGVTVMPTDPTAGALPHVDVWMLMTAGALERPVESVTTRRSW
jgi:hypothetical protein